MSDCEMTDVGILSRFIVTVQHFQGFRQERVSETVGALAVELLSADSFQVSPA